MKNKTAGAMMLLIATLIWGTAFVAQSLGADRVGPFTFNGVRFLIGAFVLLPFILVTNRRNRRRDGEPSVEAPRGLLLRGGVFCGSVLFATAALQQIGIAYTTVGKAGFVNALYIVIVPILGLFFGKRVRPRTWGCIALATVGLYFLCMNGKFSLGFGDAFVLISAFTTSIHILVIDYYSPKVDGVKLACLQFIVCGALSSAAALVFERPEPQTVLAAAGPILYTGILSCGVAYTLQVLGQKYVPPVVTCLILSLEAVFSVLSGWIVLKETLSARELTGCVLMFTAILCSQLPAMGKNKAKMPSD